MEKKLELKHIHHYPISGYNALKVQFIDPYKEHNSLEVSTIGRVVGLNVWDSSNSKLVSIESDNGRRHCFSLNEIKPILRPLSDLNKPLEDGCIPLFEILKMDYMNIKHADICFIKSDGVYYGDTRLTYLNYKHHEGIQMLPYNTVQKLIKWHFDIFGLIEQGLAIDINKVK